MRLMENGILAIEELNAEIATFKGKGYDSNLCIFTAEDPKPMFLRCGDALETFVGTSGFAAFGEGNHWGIMITPDEIRREVDWEEEKPFGKALTYTLFAEDLRIQLTIIFDSDERMEYDDWKGNLPKP